MSLKKLPNGNVFSVNEIKLFIIVIINNLFMSVSKYIKS